MTQKHEKDEKPRETSYHRSLAETKANATFIRQQARATGQSRLFFAIALLSVSSLLVLPQSALLATLILSALAATPDNPIPLPPVFAFLAILLCRAVLGAMGEKRMAEVSAATRVALRHRLFAHLFNRGPVDLATYEGGELTTTLVSRIELLDGYIARYFPQSITATITLPIIALTLLFYSPLLAVMLLLCGILAPVLMTLVGIMARKTSLKHQAEMGRLSSLFLDRLRNLELLRIFSAADREAETLKASAERLRLTTMKVLRVGFLTSTSLELLATFAIALGAIHLAGVNLPPHAALFAFLLIPDFFAPLRTLLAGYHDRMMALAAASEIRTLLAPPPHPHRPVFHMERRLPEPIAPPSLDIQGISYTYPTRTTPALENITFHVSGSEFVALNGKSGAGKSTLLALLLGFIQPDRGMLAIATHPINAIDAEQRASLFAWVGQRTRLFHGTLKENIRLGKPSASDEDITRAVEAAGLAPFVASLPEGLNTLVGERGFGLSGGQAQRVALARAFLRNAPILLLDEPTTGLDEPLSRDIMQTIKNLAHNRTVLMASHDPIALEAADRIVMIPSPAEGGGGLGRGASIASKEEDTLQNKQAAP